MKRPLWLIGPVYAGALLAGVYMRITAAVSVAVAVLVVFLVGMTVPILRRRTAAMVGLVTLAIGLLSYSAVEWRSVLPLTAFHETEQTLTVRVLETPISRKTSSAYLVRVAEPLEPNDSVQASSTETLPVGTKIRLYITSDTVAPAVGDIFTTTVYLESTERSINSLYADGVYLSGFCTTYYADDIEVQRDELSWREKLNAFRRDVVLTVRRWLPGDTGALIVGICLGETAYLSESAAEDFRAAGLSHLTSVSGLHISLVSTALLMLLRKLRVPRQIASVIAAVAVLSFMALVGFPWSACRSGIMILLYLAAELISRRADSRNSLGGALLLICLIQPHAVCDIGLLLSFCATVGLIVLPPKIVLACNRIVWNEHRRGRPILRPLGWITQSLSITLGATLLTLPILMVAFDSISLISPLVNLLAGFPAAVLLYLSLPSLFLSRIAALEMICRPLLTAAGWISRYLLEMSSFCASLPFASIHVRETYVQFLICGGLLLLFLGYRLLGRRGVIRALALVIMVGSLGIIAHGAANRNVVSLTVMEGGKALLLRSNSHAALVAVGDNGEAMTDAYYDLRTYGVDTLDFVLLSEPQSDDYPEWRDLCSRYTVQTTILPEATDDTDLRPFVSDAGRVCTLADQPAQFWNSGILEKYAGWTRLTFGDTCILISPTSGDAAQLPQDWRQAQAVIFTGDIPKSVSLLTAAQGAWVRPEHAPKVSQLVFNYPLTVLDSEDTLEILTRGQADVTLVN